jgi:O-antigen ligase
VRYALPTLLLLYFLWRSLRQRVFVLGIPFLMFMSYSVFFDKMKPFWVPQRIDPVDHLMVWLVITWLLYFDLLLPRHARRVRERRPFGPPLASGEEAVLVAIAAYVVLQIGLTTLRYTGFGSAVTEAKSFIYLLLGYFLLRGIFCHAARKDTLDFLAAVVVVDAIAGGLYVLHQGLHKTIYIATENQSIVFNGQHLTRSFYFMPQFLLLAIPYCVARRRLGPFWLGVLIVTLAAVWVSYTRSLLVIAFVEIAVVLGLRLVKAREAWPALKRAGQIVAVVAVCAVAAFALLPTQSDYLLSRLRQAVSGGGPTHATNVVTRINEERATYRFISSQDPWLGAGFTSTSQDPHLGQVEGMASDLVWVSTLYRLGLLGVIAVVCLFVAAAWRAGRLSLSAGGEAEMLSIVLCAVVVGLFLQGFVSWTLLDPERTPVALWFLAALAGETWRRRREAAAAPAAAAPGAELAALERAVND